MRCTRAQKGICMKQAIQVMTREILRILDGQEPSLYLFGSVTMDDFHLGWSDIDFLCLTKQSISPAQREELVPLRQTLLKTEPGNPYYRSFEGGMLSLDAFLTGKPEPAVYWGTSGQRVTEQYHFDCFSMVELLDFGILLAGEEVRPMMHRPSREELRRGVEEHLRSIRQYGSSTGESLYSYGWLLDISRCLYTLETGGIIAKTAAGDWALVRGLCPVPGTLREALAVRRCPEAFHTDAEVRRRAAQLGDEVRRYGNVLEERLRVGMPIE